MRKLLLFAVLCCVYTVSATEKPTVIGTIAPVTSLIAAVAGDTAHCVSLLPPGRSPHEHSFTPLEMVNVTKAQVWVTVGLPIEEILRSRLAASAAHLHIVSGQAGVKTLPMLAGHHHHAEEHEKEHRHAETHEHAAERQHHHTHQHDHHHAHDDDAENVDPHIWLDPRRALRIVDNITQGLCTAFPRNADTYRANAQKLASALQQVDRDLERALAPLKGKKIIVFHPAFGYFCERYGMTQLPIELGGHAPSAAWLSQIISTAKKENIKTVFVQPQFNTANAQTAARAIGGKVVEFDALPADYLGYFRTIADKLMAP